MSGRAARLAALVAALVCAQAAAHVPPEALQYRRPLIASARVVWGMDAPVAVFAAQVHQESGWRESARSRFAAGLAQFTPATAEWIGTAYADLADPQPMNPGWALRALVRYDRHLYGRVRASTECDRWAMTLSAYNGGLGWVRKEQAEAAVMGIETERWFGAVEQVCLRARWACAENRDYPRKILLRWQPLYRSWGPGVECA